MSSTSTSTFPFSLAAAGTVQGTRLISTVATGLSPLVAASTTVSTNLNADLLDGQHSAYFLNTSSGSQVKTGALYLGVVNASDLTARISLVLPTAEPTGPVNGSCYWDDATNEFFIYGTPYGWNSISAFTLSNIPTTEPTSPVNGSCYWDNITSMFYIYDSLYGWKSVLLSA